MFELLWEFFNISVVRRTEVILPGSRSSWAEVLHQHLERRGPRAPVSGADTGVEWPGVRETWAFREWVRNEPREIDGDSAGYQGELGHRRFKYQDGELDDDQEAEEKIYWGDEYETGTLGEWLLWGEMGVSGKRKRVSVGGRVTKKVVV